MLATAMLTPPTIKEMAWGFGSDKLEQRYLPCRNNRNDGKWGARKGRLSLSLTRFLPAKLRQQLMPVIKCREK